VTGPPNPSAEYFLVVIREFRGHDRRTEGGQSRSSGAASVSLQIACDFDFPAAPSSDGTYNNEPGVVSSGRMGGPYRSILGGGGDRIHAVPATESSLLHFFGAPLVAATFSHRAVRDANATLLRSFGTPLVAATFSHCAVRDANALLDGSVGAPLVAATFLLCAVLDANAPLDGSVGAPLVAATFTFSPRAMHGANSPLDGSVWAPLIAAM
jgi:hypothetical protein